MLSALLRSGDVKDYTALGQDGQAVFSVASQLRDTIRLKRGRMFADYLAVPQRNDQGSRIDWYVPFESDQSDGQYVIIPWTAATAEERALALNELRVFERNMADLGVEMSKSSNLKGDNLLFSRLLYAEPNNPHSTENLKALRFPNPEHVYLVNGRPVITFWGFVEKHANIYGSPFLPLEPPKASVAQESIPNATHTSEPPVTPPPVAPKKKNHWLCCIPLLLLLLLIPFLLYWFGFFGPKVGFALPTFQSEIQASQDPVVAEPELGNVAEKKIDGELYRKVDGYWVDDNGERVADPNLLGRLDDLDGKAATAVDPNQAQSAVDNGENAALPAEDTANVPTGAEDNAANANAADTDNDKAKNGQNALQPDPNSAAATTPSPEDKKNQVANSNGVNATDDQADSANDAQGSNKANNGKSPLQIPASSLANGNTDFLNGGWHAGAGIQDKTTGKPLSLDYQFQNGSGKVKLQRGDGVQCVGNVNASIRNGGLNIANQGAATCSDGSTYQLPNVECKPGATRSADCQGINGQSRFPMTIKK